MDEQKNKLILLVDDDQDFLEILSTKLKDQGFNIEIAKNGKEALENRNGWYRYRYRISKKL